MTLSFLSPQNRFCPYSLLDECYKGGRETISKTVFEVCRHVSYLFHEPQLVRLARHQRHRHGATGLEAHIGHCTDAC